MTRDPILVHCGTCSHEWAIGFAPIRAEVSARVGKQPCPSCESRDVRLGALPRETPDGDAIGWLTNGDTGISSEAIWHVMMGREITSRWGAGVPRDPSDFGRCYRLLKVMPSWRARLPEVAAKYPHWRGLVAEWDELTALYEEEEPSGRAPKLYKRIKELIEVRP